jgi:uncharacterized protein YnzC (UPF0291/DUF896 family)
MTLPPFENMTPEEILAYQASDAEQERAEELAEKNKVGTLTKEEREEWKNMLRLDALVASLKARALEALDNT